MSFILDALKKSENERQDQSPAEFASVPSGGAAPRAPRWLWVLALLLLANIVVLVGLFMRDDTQVALDTASASVETEAAVEPQPATEPSFEDRIEKAREQQPVVIARAAEPPRDERQNIPAPEPITAQPGTPDTIATSPAEFTLRALPTAAELRANGTLQMAELHLDIHVYSDTPADRFVFINMVRHKEDSRLAEGPVVREITPEGVILDYLGTEFLLPRD